MFQLHPQLAADTTTIGYFPLCQVLLSKSDLGPWLILVPRIESVREIHHLAERDQQQLMRESCLVATTLESHYSPDKINVASLGNMVSQLHVHHVARFKTDAAWPGPIWGHISTQQTRDKTRQVTLAERIKQQLSHPSFMPAE